MKIAVCQLMPVGRSVFISSLLISISLISLLIGAMGLVDSCTT